MRKSTILLFEILPPEDWSELLIRLLQEADGCPFTIHRERAGSVAVEVIARQLAAAATRHAVTATLLVVNPAASDQVVPILKAAVRPPQPLIIVTEMRDTLQIVEALREGAVDFVMPPFRDLLPRLLRHLKCEQAEAESVRSLKEKLGLQSFIGESQALITELKKIPALARCDETVLINGETGTGKELCARAIHYLGVRRTKPFVATNCGAVPVHLIENELFGHVPGAYTGAGAARSGLIDSADGGTLFLDEIDSLPLAAQVKLLRFLQDKEFRPLGASKTKRADVRVIAASNASLLQAVQRDRFRKDLYFRVNVMALDLPPLRERGEDIRLLGRHFLDKYATQFRRPAKDFSPRAWQKLMLYDWPGNVRELENVVERGVVLCDGCMIEEEQLAIEWREKQHLSGSFHALKAEAIARFEREYLQEQLVIHEGNISHAARAAQKHRRAFWELMRKHQMTVNGHLASPPAPC